MAAAQPRLLLSPPFSFAGSMRLRFVTYFPAIFLEFSAFQRAFLLLFAIVYSLLRFAGWLILYFSFE